MNEEAQVAAAGVESQVPSVPYGTDHIEKLLDVAVEGYKNYKNLKKEDSVMQKVSAFLPAVVKAVTALESISKAGPEMKDIDANEIKALSDKYVPEFGAQGKAAVYLAEGANILIAAFRIIKAK